MKGQGLLLVLLGLALAAGTLAAQEDDDPEKQAKLLVAKLGQTQVQDLWKVSDALSALGQEVIPVIQAGLEHPTEKVQLGCGRALIQMGEDDDDTLPADATERQPRRPGGFDLRRALRRGRAQDTSPQRHERG